MTKQEELKKRRLFWYKPTESKFMWQHYRMSNGGIFQMMRFGLFGVNYYGN